ncbi:oxidoreductase [Catenuloplanes japonicus]|uniref:oxidoreductase n=1 Tax=Catenuloplanes japonicus TaxID=33876 RepID=UPI0005253B6A|nr:oxidoreductase [Catenuloplanes japonicus]
MRTWLITGTSAGLGRALADEVLARGDRVVLTARNPKARTAENALTLALDVTDREQVNAVVAEAEKWSGGIDVLVNNAGYGYRAAIEEGDDDDVRRLFATNVFGPVALMKAVLPGMRARRRGTIINISSIGAQLCPPGSGYYAATKAALEGLTGSLRHEAAHLGIRVMAVEPGAFRTDFAGRSLEQAATPIADYAETAGRRRKEHDTVNGNQPGDPAKAAVAIAEAVDAPELPGLLLLGPDAVTAAEAALQTRRAELDRWRSVSEGTDL